MIEVIDTSKSLAELTGLSVKREEVSGLSSQAAERRIWLTTPLRELVPEVLWKLFQSGFGTEFLIPIAIEHLERNYELRALTVSVLGCLDYPWVEHPDLVRRLRSVIGSALRDLDEWDGSREIVIEAMQQRIPILEAALAWEKSLSRVNGESVY